jgi:exopolysaccharide biosynthesis WecB/TagA/CpsF family protein
MKDHPHGTVPFLGLPLMVGDLERMADWIAEQAARPAAAPVPVAHINVHNYYHLRRDPDSFRRVRQHYRLIFDGIGMKIGAYLLGLGLLPDLNGTDMFPLVMERASERNLGVYFLGGTPEVVERAVRATRERVPGIDIRGFRHGYFQSAEEPGIADAVARSGAALVLLSRGSDIQDRFVLRYRDRLGAPVIWNVGGLFDFISGAKPRAPAPIRRLRAEWLFRFLLEPRRMWHRNLVAAPWFLGHVIRQRLSRGAARGDAAWKNDHVGP